MRSPLIFRLFKSGQLVGVKQFDQDQIVVGRGGDVHLALEDDSVSPIHCLIEKREDSYYICDLGSQSGTFKNGQAVLDEAISSGDEVDIGQFKLSFFVGVPKAKPTGNTVITPAPVPVAENTVAAAAPAVEVPVIPPTPPPQVEEIVIPEPEPVNPVEASMPPAAVVKKEEVVVVPVIPPVIPMDVPAPVVEEERPSIAAVPVKPELQQ